MEESFWIVVRNYGSLAALAGGAYAVIRAVIAGSVRISLLEQRTAHLEQKVDLISEIREDVREMKARLEERA